MSVLTASGVTVSVLTASVLTVSGHDVTMSAESGPETDAPRTDQARADRQPGFAAAQDRIESFEPQPPNWLKPARNRVIALPGGLLIWKFAVAVVGAAIVALGIVLVPLPGPGWAIVFLGLAVWATEFAWAQRTLGWARGILKSWTDWALRQSLFVRGLLALVGLAFLAGLALFGYWTFVR